MKMLIPPLHFLDALSSDADAATFAFYVATFVSLAVSLAVSLQDQSRATLPLFARRLATVTQDRFRLRLHRSTAAPVLAGRQSVPVSWQAIQYGSLHAAMVTLPVLRLPAFEHLAQVCGWLLQGLETDAYATLHYAPLPATLPHLDDLRPQERQILKLMVQGVSITKIGQMLALGRRTIEHYQQHLYSTLGVTNAQDAAYLGLRMGLLQEE